AHATRTPTAGISIVSRVIDDDGDAENRAGRAGGLVVGGICVVAGEIDDELHGGAAVGTIVIRVIATKVDDGGELAHIIGVGTGRAVDDPTGVGLLGG